MIGDQILQLGYLRNSVVSGTCFRFNSDGTVYSNSVGRVGGLTLYLDVKLAEYYVGHSADSPGFSVRAKNLAI